MNHDTLFKALDGLDAYHGGTYRYPGLNRWTRHLDPDRVEACEYGYHLARGPQVLDWLAPTLYVAEPCTDHPVVEAGDKVVTCRARLVRRLNWDDQTARLCAADFAEAALLGERARGREPDDRSWVAAAAARLYARGRLTREELAAAGAAARAAAWAAQYDRLRLYLTGADLPPVTALYGEES